MPLRLQVRAAITLVAVLFVLTVSAEAEDVCRGKDKHGNPVSHPCNGISVGAPKVFDNRTLTLMLEALSQTLQAQQQNYIDQKSVAAALSNIQGFSQTETSTNLSLTTTPTPATDVKTTLNTGNVDANGNPLPNTFQRQTDVNRPSVTPQAPALDTFPAFQGFTPTYGNSASDLLSDQVNLTYQIFNLRMILERALSDRLLSPMAGVENRTRRQAVLGFNVTLDPPRTANDAVAVVEITLQTCDKKEETCLEEAKNESKNKDEDKNKDADRKPLSMVALMPQEKTYNAAALSSKSNAFAGSAVVSSFQVGFSARKRGQIFYLYRDNDTISYERMTGDPKKIVFGWMFRPVLGRRSVSPGLRQLFAIMALPNVDCLEVDKSTQKDKNGNPCPAQLISNVRTYWKKYDRGTLTSFERRDTNRAKEFWYGLSLTLAEPQIFDHDKYVNKAAYTVDVRPSSEYEHDLKPTVSEVAWRPVGSKNVLISVNGNNFFTNTQIAIGDKIYAKPEDGLVLKSNQGFDLVAPLDALVNGPGTLIGRYGTGVPLTKPSGLPVGFGDNGVQITGVNIHPSLGGHHRIEIFLQGIPSDDVVAQDRAARTHLLQVQSKLQEIEKRQKMVEDAIEAQNTAKNHAAALLAQQNVLAMTAQFGDLAALEAKASSVSAEVEKAKLEAAEKHKQLVDSWTSNGLRDLNNYSPVISVNGKALDLPYYKSPDLRDTRLQADVSDSDLADGGGVVKVSWPFYPADKWTVSAPFYDPDKAFEVTRVSAKSIVIHRNDGFSFVKGPEIAPETSACWKLIAGETELPLTTEACPMPKECQKKAEPCPPLPLGPISASTVTATVADLPDKVVLVAPSGAIYNLPVPPVKAKDDKVVPIELKQYDSQWIEIKSGDLTTSSTAAAGSAAAKGAKDFTGLTAVEANNGPVNYVLPDPDPKVIDEKTKKPKPPTSVKVEIARALTSKPGTIDIAFRVGTKLLGTRQIHITQTEWGNKGDK